MSGLTPHVVDINDDPLVDWTIDPRFEFGSEVDALEMLTALGEELRSAREHVRHCMRYVTAAVRAAGEVTEDGEKISKEAIINHAGVARQTVYNILGEG